MGSVLHKTTLEYKPSVADMAGRFPTSDWVHRPDLSNVEGVAKKYWVTPVTGTGPVEMDAAAKVVKDAEILAASKSATVTSILTETAPHSALDDHDWALNTDGLTISFTLDLLIDDSVTAAADASLTTYVEASLIHDSDEAEEDSLVLMMRTKTDGSYGDLDSNESLIDVLGEWTIVANGTELVEVT